LAEGFLLINSLFVLVSSCIFKHGRIM